MDRNAAPTAGNAGISRSPTSRRSPMPVGPWASSRGCCRLWRCCGWMASSACSFMPKTSRWFDFRDDHTQLDRGPMPSDFVTPDWIGRLWLQLAWIPACAGMTHQRHPRLDRGSMPSDFVTPDWIGRPWLQLAWIPACAGMTTGRMTTALGGRCQSSVKRSVKIACGLKILKYSFCKFSILF